MMEYLCDQGGSDPTLGFRSFSYKGLQRCPTSNWRGGTGVKGGFKQEISPHGGENEGFTGKSKSLVQGNEVRARAFSSVGGQGYSRSTDFQLKRTPPVRVEVSHAYGTTEILDMYGYQ